MVQAIGIQSHIEFIKVTWHIIGTGLQIYGYVWLLFLFFRSFA